MGHPVHSSIVGQAWTWLWDSVRWLADVARGFFLGLVGVVFVGRRPRGCRPVGIGGASGASYHGCGRASRYGNPQRFVPLCQNCARRTVEGEDLILCLRGESPRFSLPTAAFVPLAALGCAGALLLALLMVCVDGGKPVFRPAFSLEQLFGARRAEGATDAAPTPLPLALEPPAAPLKAPAVPAVPMPSALERFRIIQEGPADRPADGKAAKRPVAHSLPAVPPESEGSGSAAAN